MAISDEQPVNVGNLKAVFDAYRESQEEILKTFVDYLGAYTGDPFLSKSDDIQYQELSGYYYKFTFNTPGVYLIETADAYNTDSGRTPRCTLTYPNGSFKELYIYESQASFDTNTRIQVEAGQYLQFGGTYYTYFGLKMHRIA